MAYRALYRAYRPQSFEEVAGQRHVTQTLKNAILENKIAHAYLFCGPRGTGKTSIAKIFAKAINCEHPEKNVPCNTCDNCLAITRGEHPDILEIDAASNNGVDEVRDLIEKVKYAPIKGRYKVYIIDEVHMMSSGAFNALLKTLEEPPSHVVFILATTEPQKVLPTIISRCQRFDFTRLTLKDIEAYLAKVLQKEGVSYEIEALSLIATLAEGGMRDSLSILEQCLAYSGKHLALCDVQQVYGLISNPAKIAFILRLLRQDMAGVLADLAKMNESGTDIRRLTFDLIQILKDVIIYKNVPDEKLLFILSMEEIQQIAPYIGADECFDYIDIFTHAIARYREAGDAKLYFELACMRICNRIHDQRPTPDIPADDDVLEPKQETMPIETMSEQPVLPSVTDNHEKSEPLPVKTEEPIPIEESDAKAHSETTEVDAVPLDGDIAVDFKDILNILVQASRQILVADQERWPTIKRYLANINTAKYATMLMDSAPVAACSGGLILACAYQPLVNQLNDPQQYFGVKKFLKEVLGEDYDYIAVTKDQWTDIRNSYLKLRQVNRLPKPHAITVSHIRVSESEANRTPLTEGQQFAVDLFGDIVEIVEE